MRDLELYPQTSCGFLSGMAQGQMMVAERSWDMQAQLASLVVQPMYEIIVSLNDTINAEAPGDNGGGRGLHVSIRDTLVTQIPYV